MENEQVDLFFSDIAQGGTSDKEYRLQLKAAGAGYVVEVQYGRRGGALKAESKTKQGAVAYELAKKLYDSTLREKVAKGYRGAEGEKKPVQGAQEEAAPAALYTPFVPKQSAGVIPEGLESIEAQQIGYYVVSDRYWFQEKRDGQKRLVRKREVEGRYIYEGINKLGQTVPVADWMRQELADLDADEFLLDGELEGDKYVVYDALDIDGDIRSMPYEFRLRNLARIFASLERARAGRNGQLVTLLPTWKTEEEKIEAIKLLRDVRAEGIVVKDKTALYQEARKAQHKKLKFVKSLSARVSRNHPDGKDSVFVELLDVATGKWVEVGGVSVAAKYGRREPGEIIEVRYLYATEGKRLYQPSYLGLRTDVRPEECTMAQMIFKQGVNLQNGVAA